MPKSRKVVKHDGRIFRMKVSTKFLIGNRKTGVSANLMSNSALEAVMVDKNKTKFHNKARQVLATRAA